MNSADFRKLSNYERGYQAVHHTAWLFSGFTLIKWVQMENGLWSKLRFSFCSVLDSVSYFLPPYKSPCRLTPHYTLHTHAGLLCTVTIIKTGRLSQQMFLLGSPGCLLQTTGPGASCVTVDFKSRGSIFMSAVNTWFWHNQAAAHI